MNPEARIRLARAHVALAVLTLLLAAAAMLLPSGTSASPKPQLENPALVLRAAALAYLVLSAVSEWQRAESLKMIDRAAPQRSLLALLGHIWVLWVAGAAALRGAASRALLAGCDPVLAALITASGLAMALLVAEWWQRRRTRDDRRGDGRTASRLQWPAWLACIAGWLVVLALWYIETIPLPNR